PGPEQLWDGDICFFSLDTDLIQAAAYKFESPPLNKLPAQLPPKMTLILSPIVFEEIVSHQMDSVEEAVSKIRSGINSLRRHVPDYFVLADLPIREPDVLGLARETFAASIRGYLDRCEGGVLDLAGK